LTIGNINEPIGKQVPVMPEAMVKKTVKRKLKINECRLCRVQKTISHEQ